jgi:hypothetical protein
VPVFKIEQTEIQEREYFVAMADPNSIKILSAEREGDDGLLVNFSDHSSAGYVVEELLALRPHREPTPPFTTKIRQTHAEPYFPKDLPPAMG